MATTKNSSSFKIIIFLTIIVFAAITIFVIVSNNNNKEEGNEVVFDNQPSTEGQPILGDDSAPVQVVEFGDFKCPACKSWGETVFPQLEEDYIDKGEVQFSYINVLFHGDESKVGSIAAESVLDLEPESYWSFHKKLFEAQPANDHDTAWLTMDKVNEVAEETTNIDPNDLLEKMQTKEVIDSVNEDITLVNDFKVKLTPSIMVNGKMLEDPFDYERIKVLIDEALAGKE
ncbi:DsbA family protein [Cytobacillus purgationiresistens]|uniref:Protein-disulfide isomerase n=1 Tax=Cytobacillus purgationiresistens TaxID=863449 RepID=A0ABU0AH72_9BACI|nr:thioredoxin domain-containing protein [Cytobacillus purgationiresistens]MDQ0270611.1 protein-disulfide isomerase [Cytobacillus purgationiresistens]